MVSAARCILRSRWFDDPLGHLSFSFLDEKLLVVELDLVCGETILTAHVPLLYSLILRSLSLLPRNADAGSVC